MFIEVYMQNQSIILLIEIHFPERLFREESISWEGTVPQLQCNQV